MPETMRPEREAGTRRRDDPYYVDPGRGWILFSGIMLAVLGALNVSHGIAAVTDSTFFVADAKFVFANLNTWGWILTIVGVVQLVAAYGVWAATEWGRWLGIALVSINIIVQFFILPAAPVWAVMVFSIDVIVLYGLASYGGKDRWSLDG
jgi:uncharacterized membrane protein (DUF2068 family)